MSTLKELAASLNLSAMAVSKALRDAPDISVGTKARVLAEARRRNYVPNRAAQNLRLKRSGLIGVVVPNINHTYYSNLVWGIERQAEAMGLQMLLAHSLDQAENEMREVQKLISRQIEALLLAPAIRWQHRLTTLELLRASRIPAVLLDAYPAGAENFPTVSWVVCDDQRGGRLATEHLLQLGHREILFLAGPNGSSSSAGRFSGYQRALAAAGVTYSDTRVYLAARDIDSGRKAMAQALSEKSPFTAVVAHNDSVAIGAAETLLQQGFRVPEDVSIVGFGDGVLAANFRTPLTTVRAPQTEMGEAALRLAMELRKGRPVEPRQLPVEIIIRSSTVGLASAGS
ncbi:MAG TPA: LacI family DNA-binding transcriptional regulator [Candidatus Methylacidiphilales bacterium]|nr:LacI family DNA-binding transcriptional regulator [Candidatus Methylacidiphilales bacterium]